MYFFLTAKLYLVLLVVVSITTPILCRPCKGEFLFNEIPENFTLETLAPMLQQPGAINEKANTDSIDAQKWFNIGLMFYFGFSQDAAFWAFNMSNMVDKNMIIGYWGQAIALGPNLNVPVTAKRYDQARRIIYAAKHMLESQMSASMPSSSSDALYIEALCKRYQSESYDEDTQKQQNQDYVDAMYNLTQAYPEDVNGLVLYGESLMLLQPWEWYDMETKEPTPAVAKAVTAIDRALQLNSDHIGAHHFLIHSVEMSKDPRRALASADRMQELVYDDAYLGHLLHMSSHIYDQMGELERMVNGTLRGARSDEKYIATFGKDGLYPIHYLTHNYYVLARAYANMGDRENGIEFATKTVNFYAPQFKHFMDMEYHAAAQIFGYLRLCMWDEMLTLPAPLFNEMNMTNALYHFGKALAHAKQKNFGDSLIEMAIFRTYKALIPSGAQFSSANASDILAVAETLVNATIAELSGDFPAAEQYYNASATFHENIPYGEPDAWYSPVKESLAAFYMRSNVQFDVAEKLFREVLEADHGNAHALFGLHYAYDKQNKADALNDVQPLFEKAWSHSDYTLTIDCL